MEKKVQEENLKNLLAFCNADDNDFIKKRQQSRGDNKSGIEDQSCFKRESKDDNSSNESQSELVESEPIHE